MKKVSGLTDVISINPMNIQRGTMVEGLWKKGQYRTPWLWTVVKLLLASPTDVRTISSPTGGGKRRGAHNCGKCDRDILDAIEEFSLSGQRKKLEHVMKKGCTCKLAWEDQLKYDGLFPPTTSIEKWRDTTWKT